MFIGLIIIAASLAILVRAEMCRRDSEKCKDAFMTEIGWTRSLVAIKYIGRPKDARHDIVEDADLRRRFLIESYIVGVMGMLLGIWAIVDLTG